MKISEIIQVASRSEEIDEYLNYFGNSKVVASVKNMTLRKVIDEFGGIHYGLFNPAGQLISYQHLVKQDRFYVSSMPITRDEYQNQGWMTYIMDYAVLTDKLTVASDTQQTPEAIKLWKALARNARYRIFLYNKRTGEKILFRSGSRNPWKGQTDDTFLITEYSQELADNEAEWFARQQHVRRLIPRPTLKEDFYYGTNPSPLFWNP